MDPFAVFVSLIVVAFMDLLVGAAALLPSGSPDFRRVCVPIAMGLLALAVPFGAFAALH